MSQDNVEMYRRIHGIGNLSDSDAEATLAPLLAPQFHVTNAPTAVTDNSYLGLAGALRWRTDLVEGFAEGARYEVEEIIAASSEFVVGRLALVGVGARSGAPLHLRWISVLWFRDGKATHGKGYGTRGEALKAVGLED